MKAVLLLFVPLAGLAPILMSRGATQDPDLPAPTTLVAQEGCVTTDCHGSVKDHDYLHGPLFVDACDSCHTQIDIEGHGFQLARSPEELCTFCHEFEHASEGTLHAPIEGGECLPCHDPHGGQEPRLLQDAGNQEMCLGCHVDTTAGHTSVHAPVVDDACFVCHESHASANPGLLVTDGKQLCLDCHTTLEARLEVSNVVHAPVQDECSLCHDPHAGEGPGLLIQESVALCVSCHTDVGHLMEVEGGQHSAVTSEGSCLTCHDPHASDERRLLREGAVALCLDCHDEPLVSDQGAEIANMRAIFEERLNLHGPVAEGDCAACHTVHGGPREGLLTADLATGIYSPWNESSAALCFTCHDRQLAELEHSAQVTGFRNGDLNLHAVHVNRENKGRTCNLCHDPHASNNGHHLRDGILFGPRAWPLPIDWRGTPNGGTCSSGCHRPYEYDRVVPVAYPVLPAGEFDFSGGKYLPPELPTEPALEVDRPGSADPHSTRAIAADRAAPASSDEQP